MSRIMKVMIVLLTIAAMVTPVMAEDRLSLNGQMRVRGWYMDDGGDYTDSYFDQRLRIGGKLSIAEGVSVTFRFDETEAKWGDRNSAGKNRQGVRFIESEKGMQWDRAHLDLDFGSFKLRAGQYFAGGFSASDVVNAQDAGFMVTSGPVTAFFQLDSNVDNLGGNSDFYLWGAKFGQKIDTIKYDAFVAEHKMDAYEVYLVGADVALDLDAVKIIAELDYFTGDYDASTDAMGLQGWADVSFAATETVTIGGQLWYAAAADDDEAQIVVLGNDFGGWDPLAAVGTGLDNEQMAIGRPFDFFGGGAGVIGIGGYGSVKATDSLAIGAKVTYLEPEDDNKTDADSAVVAAVGTSYDLMANTKLDALLQYVDVDAPDTDAFYGVGVGLFVNF